MNRSKSVRSALVSSVVLGMTAGMRSQMPMALLARNADIHGPAFFGKRAVKVNLYLSAAGEIVGDKLPMVPSRLNPGPLSGRITFGLASGGILARRLDAPVAVGIIGGAAGAVAGSFAGYHARAWLVQKTGLPDPLWAIFEDGLALTIGSVASR